MLDLNDLSLSVQVVRAGRFSEAARCLRIPANVLSRRIDQLEGQPGTRSVASLDTQSPSSLAEHRVPNT